MATTIDPDFETVLWTTVPCGFGELPGQRKLAVVASPFPAGKDDVVGTVWSDWMYAMFDDQGALVRSYLLSLEGYQAAGGVDPDSSMPGTPITDWNIQHNPPGEAPSNLDDPRKLWHLIFPNDTLADPDGSGGARSVSSVGQQLSNQLKYRTPLTFTTNATTHSATSIVGIARRNVEAGYFRSLQKQLQAAGDSWQKATVQNAADQAKDDALFDGSELSTVELNWLKPDAELPASVVGKLYPLFQNWIHRKVADASTALQGYRAERFLRRVKKLPAAEQGDDAVAVAWQLSLVRGESAGSPDLDNQITDLSQPNRLRVLERLQAVLSQPPNINTFADQFRFWILNNLAPGNPDPARPFAARRAERNAYRLSKHPWTELDDDALAAAWSGALLKPLSTDINAQSTPADLHDLQRLFIDLKANRPAKYSALRMMLFHRRVPNRNKRSTHEFALGDIRDLKALANILVNAIAIGNRFASWQWQQLDLGLQSAVTTYAAVVDADPGDLELKLVEALNAGVRNGFDPALGLFANIPLRAETEHLSRISPGLADPQFKLWNRQLIEDACAVALLPIPSFAQKIAMLNNYPQLMRRLGLILDFAVTPTDASPWTHIRLVIEKGGKPIGHFPWTPLNAAAFRPAPVSNVLAEVSKLYKNEMLAKVNLTVYSVAGDAQVMKMAAQAHGPRGRLKRAADPESTPAARATGISVAINDRGEAVLAQMQGPAKTTNRDQLPAVGFESMVRGYVPHVSVAAGNGDPFLPLFARDEAYEILQSNGGANPCFSPPPLSPPDYYYGYVAGVAASTHDVTSNNPPQPLPKDLHVHDDIMHWTGWSFTTGSPIGTKARLDDDGTDPAAPGNDQPLSAAYSPQIKTHFTVPDKTLPKLKFGTFYKFQFPCMDITGYAPVADASQAECITDSFPYLREDPVPPPEVLLVRHLSATESPGEQLTQLVVRSGLDGENTRECLRALVPPKASFALANQCGLFDNCSPYDVGSFKEAFLPPKGHGRFPSDYAEFTLSDLLNLPALASALRGASNSKFPPFLGELVSPDTLREATAQPLKDAELSRLLVADLNRVIRGKSIYNSMRFASVSLRADTVTLMKEDPNGTDLIVLNRLLLEDAYDGLLAKGRRNPIFVPPKGSPQSCLYLPDPFASGIALQITDLEQNLPVLFSDNERGSTSNAGGEMFMHLPFYTEGHHWPHAKMYLLALITVESASRDVLVSINRRQLPGAGWRLYDTVVISVPPGKEVSVSLQSSIRGDCPVESVGSRAATKPEPATDSHLALMAAYRRSRDKIVASARLGGRAVEPVQLHEYLAQFVSPLMSPPRNLTLVHAIPSLRLTPVVRSLVLADRHVSESFQAFKHLQIGVDRASTGSVHVSSNWQEWDDSDRKNITMPKIVPKSQPVCEMTMVPPPLIDLPGPPTFSADDITDLAGIVNLLLSAPPLPLPPSPLEGCIYSWVNTSFTSAVKQHMSPFPATQIGRDSLQQEIVDNLNALVQGAQINKILLINVIVPPATTKLLDYVTGLPAPDGNLVVVLNRLLLEAAFPNQLTQSNGANPGYSEEPLETNSFAGRWPAELHGPNQAFPRVLGSIRQDFTDTRHRIVNYVLSGTSRFGKYFNGPLPANVLSDPFPVSIPNAAVPTKPEVAYIIPTFHWKSTGDFHQGKPQTSGRTGGGCRIWLKRPWYMTGMGEQLGLVVWNENDAALGRQDGTRQLVTRWGADPIWDDDAPTYGPAPSDVLSGNTTLKTVPMMITTPITGEQLHVSVLPLTPVYDPDQDLWYADVRFVNVPSYFSFIRLAFVRYQRHSISGCAFSDIAVADFFQLAPDRLVTVIPTTCNHVKVLLQGDVSNRANCYSLQIQQCRDLATAGRLWKSTEESWGNEEDKSNALACWNVQLPEGCSGSRRVVVREYEQYEEDDQVGNDLPSTTRAVKRLVFANVFEI